MVDKDTGQRTTAVVAALWRALCMWRWFVQPAIVWFRGARPRRPPHWQPPPLRAHTGGGVWWWDHGQCRGSGVRHGVALVLGQQDQEGEDRGAEGGSLGATETWEKEEEKRQKDWSGLARTWVEKKEEPEKRAREP